MDGKAGLQPFLWEFWAMQVSTRVGYPKSSQEARSKEKQIVAFPWRVQHCPPCTHAHSEEKLLPNMVNEHHTEGLKVTKTPECTATCIQRAEVREAARRPTLRRAASITKSCTAPNANSLQVEKRWSRESSELKWWPLSVH